MNGVAVESVPMKTAMNHREPSAAWRARRANRRGAGAGEVARRGGARCASMDRDGMLEPDENANDKLIQDVKNYLATNGISQDDITVEIKDFENPEQDFDIDDPGNDLKLFEVRVSVDWSSVSLTPVSAASDYPLVARVVFRNGRATISD